MNVRISPSHGLCLTSGGRHGDDPLDHEAREEVARPASKVDWQIAFLLPGSDQRDPSFGLATTRDRAHGQKRSVSNTDLPRSPSAWSGAALLGLSQT